MKSEVHSALCGFKTPCEHQHHLHGGESGNIAIHGESGVEFFTMFIIISREAIFFGLREAAEQLLISSVLTHTYDVYTIHATLGYSAKPSFPITVSIVALHWRNSAKPSYRLPVSLSPAFGLARGAGSLDSSFFSSIQ